MSQSPNPFASSRITRGVVFGLLLLMAATGASRALFLTSSSNRAASVTRLAAAQRVMDEGKRGLSTVEPNRVLWVGLVAATASVTRAMDVSADPAFAGQVLGILFMVSSLLPLFWIGLWLLRGAAWGLLAAALYALVPLTWWWSGEMASDASGTAFTVWAVGMLVAWLEGRRWPWLAAACLWLGAAALVGAPVLVTAPLFLGAVMFGAWRRRRWLPAAAIFLVPLPACVVTVWLAPGTDLFAAFVPLLPVDLDIAAVKGAAAWLSVRDLAANALGPVTLWVVGLGAAAALARRRGLLLLVLVWVTPALLIRAAEPQPAIRHLLPLMPAAALLLAALVETLGQLPRGRAIASAAVTALAAIMVIHGVPNLVALDERGNALESTARWYAEQSPVNALVVAGADLHHVRFFGRREVVGFAPCIRGKTHRADPRGRTRPREKTAAFVEIVNAVDTALREGRPVYVSDFLADPSRRRLETHYRFEPAATLGGGEIRNVRDPDFARMDASWREPHDVRIARLKSNGAYPRSAPAPEVEVTRGDLLGVARITVRVHFPPGRGRICGAVVSAASDAVDWSSRQFGEDPLVRMSLAGAGETNVRLDREGRGVVRLVVRESLLAASRTLFVSYGVLGDSTGREILDGVHLWWFSLPTRVPLTVPLAPTE